LAPGLKNWVKFAVGDQSNNHPVFVVPLAWYMKSGVSLLRCWDTRVGVHDEGNKSSPCFGVVGFFICL
jgi:hypothetical protein